MSGRTLRLQFDFELDDFGTPIVHPLAGAELALRIERGRSLADPPANFTIARVSANRAGLLWLAQKCAALAHAQPNAEKIGLHVHAIDAMEGSPAGLVIDVVASRGDQDSA